MSGIYTGMGVDANGSPISILGTGSQAAYSAHEAPTTYDLGYDPTLFPWLQSGSTAQAYGKSALSDPVLAAKNYHDIGVPGMPQDQQADYKNQLADASKLYNNLADPASLQKFSSGEFSGTNLAGQDQADLTQKAQALIQQFNGDPNKAAAYAKQQAAVADAYGAGTHSDLWNKLGGFAKAIGIAATMATGAGALADAGFGTATGAGTAGSGFSAGASSGGALGSLGGAADLAGSVGDATALGGAAGDTLDSGALSSLDPSMFSNAAAASGSAPDLSLSSLTAPASATSAASSAAPDAGYIAKLLGTSNSTLKDVLSGGAGVLKLIGALQQPQTATQKQVLANENNYNANATAYSKQMIDALNNASLRRTPVAPTGNPATYGANPEQNLFTNNTGQLTYPQVPTTTPTYATGGSVDKLSVLLDEFNNKNTPHFAAGGGLPINQPKMPAVAARQQNFKPPFVRSRTPTMNSPLGHINAAPMPQFPSPTAGRHFAAGGSTTADPTDILAELGIISDGKGGYRGSQIGGAPSGIGGLREALENRGAPDLGPYAKMFIPHYNLGPRPITPAPVEKFARGGSAMPQGGGALSALSVPSHNGGAIGNFVSGDSGGQDDKINAKLSDGEFVVPADIVSALGDGNNRNGAAKLDGAMKAVRAHRNKNGKGLPPKAKNPDAYLKGGANV